MTNKNLYIIAASLLLTLPAMAQKELSGESEYRYNDASQLWRNTENTAGMTIDSISDRGIAHFNFDHTSGSYHRVQEGAQTNSLNFFTERYQKMGSYLYGYGKFHFNMGRTKERAWSDVMRTYNSNPYFAGSSIFGKYDFQNFDLTARVATINFSGWRFGASLDYKVGDLSRLRDPRSRSKMLDYKITPSITYSFGEHTLGLSGHYNRYKESQPTPTTIQEEPNLYYYQMKGMEVAEGKLKGWSGYNREYVNHNFGGALTYGYKGRSFENVTEMSIQRGTEYIYEQYKREPGRYYTYLYDFQTQNRIHSEKMLHEINLKASYQQAYADEYRPQLIITTDSVHGYTSNTYVNQFTYKKRYQLQAVAVGLHYRANLLQGNAIGSYFGITGAFNSTHQKHLLPMSTFKYHAMDVNLEYGIALLSNHRLWLDANTGYHFSNKAELNLADESTIYAQNVLLPDMEYYAANYWNGKLQITYQLPITVKGYQNLWYIKGYAQTLQAKHNLNANTFGITIGLFN